MTTLDTTTTEDDVVGRLRHDVEALVGLDRRTTRQGERESARHLAARLTAIGAEDAAVAAFPTQSSWVPAHLAHLALAADLALLKHPAARLLGAALTASYELEVSGRSKWMRRLLPSGEGSTAWARIPSAGPSRRTLVLVAHHDAAHMGMVWHPGTVAASRHLARSTGHALPTHAAALAAMAAAATPSRAMRIAGAGMLAASAALMVQSMRSPTTPGANDNASGVAAVLEVARRLAAEPLTGTTVLVVFPGGEEAGSTGILHWLRAHGGLLDPRSTLVVNLDAVGSPGSVAVARREALSNRASARAVDRAARAARDLGVPLQTITIPNPTDAAVTTLARLETVSLLSVRDGWISHLHRPTDTVDNVGWSTVHDAARLTHHLARTFDREEAGR